MICKWECTGHVTTVLFCYRRRTDDTKRQTTKWPETEATLLQKCSQTWQLCVSGNAHLLISTCVYTQTKDRLPIYLKSHQFQVVSKKLLLCSPFEDGKTKLTNVAEDAQIFWLQNSPYSLKWTKWKRSGAGGQVGGSSAGVFAGCQQGAGRMLWGLWSRPGGP